MGEGKQIVVVKLGDGSYYLGLGLHLPENWTSEQAALIEDSSALREKLLTDFADWSLSYKELIRHSDRDFYVWPLHAMPTESLSWKTVPGFTLIGDAAHVT